jgi:hypothetical protein
MFVARNGITHSHKLHVIITIGMVIATHVHQDKQKLHRHISLISLGAWTWQRSITLHFVRSVIIQEANNAVTAV